DCFGDDEALLVAGPRAGEAFIAARQDLVDECPAFLRGLLPALYQHLGPDSVGIDRDADPIPVAFLELAELAPADLVGLRRPVELDGRDLCAVVRVQRGIDLLELPLLFRDVVPIGYGQGTAAEAVGRGRPMQRPKRFRRQPRRRVALPGLQHRPEAALHAGERTRLGGLDIPLPGALVDHLPPHEQAPEGLLLQIAESLRPEMASQAELLEDRIEAGVELVLEAGWKRAVGFYIPVEVLDGDVDRNHVANGMSAHVALE